MSNDERMTKASMIKNRRHAAVHHLISRHFVELRHSDFVIVGLFRISSAAP